MANFTTSICWLALPLIAGVGIGYSLAGGKSSAGKSTGPASTSENRNPASVAIETVPSPSPAPAPTVAITPTSFDELMLLAEQSSNDFRLAHPTISHALVEVADEKIIEWFRELQARKKLRRFHEYLPVEDNAMSAVSEQLVRRLPELALEELGKGYQPFAPMLASNYPQRIPEFLRGLENPHHRRGMLYEHLLGLGSHELRRAYVEQHGNADDLEYFDDKMGTEIRHTAIHSVSHSPEDLLAILRAEGGPAHSLSAAAGKLVQCFQSPQAAIEFAQANEFADLPDQAKHRFYGDLLSKLAVDDPQAAGAWLNTLQEESISKILEQSLGSMAWLAAEQAKVLIKTVDPSLRPRNGYEVIARGLAKPDSGALKWYLENTNNGSDRKSLETVLQATVRRDPEAVLEFVSNNPEYLNDKADFGARLAGQIVKADPAKAELLLDKLEGIESVGASGAAIGRNWARVDAAAARAHLETIDDPALREAFVAGIASSENDWQETLAWVRDLEGTERDRGLALVLSRAKNDPATSAAAASEWLNDAPPPSGEPLSEGTKNAISQVGAAIAESAPVEAGDWATNLPEGPAREQAIATVSEKWSSFDPAGTSEWLLELPASDSRDTAIGNLVTNIADDPVGAFSWSLIVTDPTKRGELLDGVVRDWRRSDPDAAREAIESAVELSPQEQQQLLQKVDDAR